MYQDLSIRKKLSVGFGAIVVIFLLLLVSAYQNLMRLHEANNWDRHTLRVLHQADSIHKNLLDVQAEYRGFAMTGKESYLAELDENEKEMRDGFDSMRQLVADNALQQERIRKMEAIAGDWIRTIVRPLIEKRRTLADQRGATEEMAADVRIPQGQAYIEDYKRTHAAFSGEEERLLAERSERAMQQQKRLLLTLALGGLVCIGLAIAIALLLAQSILNPLNRMTWTVNQIAGGDQSARITGVGKDEFGQVAAHFNRMAQAIQDNQAREQAATGDLKRKVDSLLEVVAKAAAGDLTGKITVSGQDAIGQLAGALATMFDNLRGLLNQVQKAGILVATSTTEIAAAARQQESTGVEQAQTSVEVLSTTKEISSNTMQLLKTMEEAAQAADHTTAASTDAQRNLARMDQTMQHMVNATDSINAKLSALSEKASNINNVLTTITKVADQTNILSLNAAIEAEKAGEAGRGFAVVATEIRRLADQTSVATWDIEQMLKEMQTAVSASVMGMDKFSEEIRRSVEEVRLVAGHLATVIEEVQKLSPRFETVFEGMQSQAVGASQITATMTQLNDATQQSVDSLRATSEAVQQLQVAANDLQASVATFSVND
jgi:methyl-accepting chemotaxis protein WspA